jgi:hypothetical protein
VSLSVNEMSRGATAEPGATPTSPRGQRRMMVNNGPQSNTLLTDVAFATLRTTRQNAKRYAGSSSSKRDLDW